MRQRSDHHCLPLQQQQHELLLQQQLWAKAFTLGPALQMAHH